MAIQIPNLGSGNGLTGDNELVIRQKYNANFSDVNHAASRVVGLLDGQIPQVQDTLKAASGRKLTWITSTTADCNTFEAGTDYVVASGVLNSPVKGGMPSTDYVVQTRYSYSSVSFDGLFQIAIGYAELAVAFRIKPVNQEWKPWTPISTNKKTYTTTTASGANVVVDAEGVLMRSTSSEQYKDILSPLVIDDTIYANAMALKPIIYRSTAEADNPLHHYFSFSAEELGALDKAFTLWRYTEQGTDTEGNVVEVPLAEPQAEGLNINAILAFGHAISIKQDAMIKSLEDRVAALETK